ncbi:Rhodopsin, GQ-coupled [Trichoplax sp. H2]|nr:Rhodopsin, GQ-coupled [Trichoplax sp. H2]|eukprot:RDD38741.1 Rhodopsin, GQ-coupled [Trichoplax sp. H2]
MDNLSNFSQALYIEDFYFVVIWDLSVGYLGFCLNLILIFLIFKSRSFNKAYDILLANQGLSDLACSAVIFTSSVYSLILHSSSMTEMHKQPVCTIAYFIMVTTFAASVIIFTAIAVDRYLSHIRNRHRDRPVRSSKVAIGITAMWITSACVAYPVIYFIEVHGPSIYSCTVTQDIMMAHFNRIFFTVLFCIFYLLPSVIIVGCYLLICISMYNQLRKWQETNMKRNWRNYERGKSVIWFSLMITAAFLLLSTPFVAILMNSAYSSHYLLDPLPKISLSRRFIVEICIIIYKSRCVVISLLHLRFRKSLRRETAEQCMCLYKVHRNEADVN